MFDFTTAPDRRNTGSFKWDYTPDPVKEKGYLPLSVADMELKTAPAIIDAVKKAAEHGVFGYTYADDAYYAAVSGYLKRHHGMELKREWLTVTNGVVTALSAAVRAFSEPGEGVIVQPPVYYPFYTSITNNGRSIVENPLVFKCGHYEMDFAGLEELCARDDIKLMLLCSPHNPVSRVWSYDELKTLGDICKRHGVFVISDEIHGDLALFGNVHTPFINIDGMADNCMVCTAASKTFNIAGLSCSNIFIANDERCKRYQAMTARSLGSGVPYFARSASIAAFTECDDYVAALKQHIEHNFEFMYDFVDSRLPHLPVIKAEGTYLAWQDMHALGLDYSALEKLMCEKAGLALDEGYIFGTGGSGFERWNLALPTSELENALLRLEAALA